MELRWKEIRRGKATEGEEGKGDGKGGREGRVRGEGKS